MESHFHGISINGRNYNNDGYMFSFVDDKIKFNVKKPNRTKKSAQWNGHGSGRADLKVPDNTHIGDTFSSLEIPDYQGGETRPANIGFKWICIAG